MLGQHIIHYRQLVLELHGPEVMVCGLFKGAPAPAHATIVGVKNSESVLGE